MAETDETDRKRRHLSSLSPIAMAKKEPFAAISEDKKVDTVVLKFQNHKLSQKLEAQKMELPNLERKLSQQKEKQLSYDRVLSSVSSCWKKLVNDLEAQSLNIRGLISSDEKVEYSGNSDGSSCSSDDMFLQRLMETNSANSFVASSFDHMIEDGYKPSDESANLLCTIISVVSDLLIMKDGLYAALLKALPEDDCRQMASKDVLVELKNLQPTFSNLLLKQISLATELRKKQDSDLKNKAELKFLQGDLESIICELRDCNQELVALKSDEEPNRGAFFPVLSTGSKHPGSDRATDDQKDAHEMESKLKESMVALSSSRLQELKCLHEERVENLKTLSSLQGILKNVKSISSARAFKLLKEEVEKFKSDVIRCQAFYEKLQVEKDKVVWKERDSIIRNDLGDTFRRTLTAAVSRIDELKLNIQRHKEQRKRIEARLKEASREPGRKEMISNFREFVSSFPRDISSMQSNLQKYKHRASDIHSLRAEEQSVSNILARKTKELGTLSSKSTNQQAEMRSLQAVVADSNESYMDFKLFADMYALESVMPRSLSEARDREFKAWAQVHSLKVSLDENNMESRVKTAIEAEALSQRGLAAAEAKIAELREKFESSKRNKSKLSTALKSKHAENAAYVSEIETIRQAYDDMRNQNQQLMKQITERDDYNIKLVLEGLQDKQTHDSLLMEKQVLQKKIQQANVCQDLFKVQEAKIKDQVKSCAEQLLRLGEERRQNTTALENTQRRLLEARKCSKPAREYLDEMQLKSESRLAKLCELKIELENERFGRKRQEEELEASRRKAKCLETQIEGSVVGKLKHELKEYKELLKCGICLDRPKEVVITKCFHLLCKPCVQKVLETSHRKCPVCAASFGPNDVKSIYL